MKENAMIDFPMCGNEIQPVSNDTAEPIIALLYLYESDAKNRMSARRAA
jgi:hypothetical protein